MLKNIKFVSSYSNCRHLSKLLNKNIFDHVTGDVFHIRLNFRLHNLSVVKISNNRLNYILLLLLIQYFETLLYNFFIVYIKLSKAFNILIIPNKNIIFKLSKTYLFGLQLLKTHLVVGLCLSSIFVVKTQGRCIGRCRLCNISYILYI